MLGKVVFFSLRFHPLISKLKHELNEQPTFQWGLFGMFAKILHRIYLFIKFRKVAISGLQPCLFVSTFSGSALRCVCLLSTHNSFRWMSRWDMIQSFSYFPTNVLILFRRDVYRVYGYVSTWFNQESWNIQRLPLAHACFFFLFSSPNGSSNARNKIQNHSISHRRTHTVDGPNRER